MNEKPTNLNDVAKEILAIFDNRDLTLSEITLVLKMLDASFIGVIQIDLLKKGAYYDNTTK